MQNRFFLHCYLSLIFGIATTATGQQYDYIEVIAPGEATKMYESHPTESYFVIEDRLISERPVGDGVLQGNIIENAIPLASERIESSTPARAADADSTSHQPSESTSNEKSEDRYGDVIQQMAQRSVKLEEELAGLKELLQKHLQTAGEQQEAVVVKLAEAIKERDDARTQFEASLKEYAIRNEQVTTLAVGLREAYDRLEAKRAESGEATENSLTMIEELRKQIAKVEAETRKAGQGLKAVASETNESVELSNTKINELAIQLKSVAADAQKSKEMAGKFEGEMKSLGGSVKTIATDVAKQSKQTEEMVDRVEGVAGHLQSIQGEIGETAESVEKLKKMVSTLEDRIKELEKNRGKAKSKKDE